MTVEKIEDRMPKQSADPDAALKSHLQDALASLGLTFDDLTDAAKQKAREAFLGVTAISEKRDG